MRGNHAAFSKVRRATAACGRQARAAVVPNRARGSAGRFHTDVPDALKALARLPARTLLAFIRVYQFTVSPVLPVVTLGGCACRFSPTCSHYAAEAIRTRGALVGTWLALCRLVRCTPLSAGGFDPVPPRKERTAGRRASRPAVVPVCRRAPRPASLSNPPISYSSRPAVFH